MIMDPISLAASVIATLQAVGATARGVESAWNLRHASRDFAILQNELNDLQCLLLQVQEIVGQAEPSSSTASVNSHVNRLCSHLQQLDEVVSTLGKPDSGNVNNAAVSYRRWVRAKSRISLLRSNITETRNNLSLAISAHLAVQNKQMHRMLLHVQGFDVTGVQIQSEHSIKNTARESMEEPVDESSDVSEPEDWFDVPDGRPATSLISQAGAIQTSVPWQSRILDPNTGQDRFFRVRGTVGITDCDYLCSCRCHIRTPLATPRWLRDLCGHLFANYIAIPWLSRRSCSLQSCKQSYHGALRVSYIFPTWLMRRMLALSMAWKDISGPGATWTIRMPRIVSYYAPIWESIRFDRVLAVRELLQTSRTSPFDIRHDGTTLLYHAFCFRRWDIARLVLSQGGSMNWEDVYGRTPLSVALVAYHSLESRPETKAEAYNFIGKSDIAEHLGFTPLHTIISQNSSEELQLYLQMDSSHLNTQDNLGRTALVLASCHSNYEAARILMQWGANPNITDRSKRSPLHFAAQRASRIIQVLMELCDEQQLSRLREATDERGRTALYFAIEFNQGENLAYLCARGLRLDVKDSLQRTVLHYAAWTGGADVMDALSQQDLSSIDLNALDSNGRTAEQCFTSLRGNVREETKEAFQRLMAAAS